MDKRLVFGDCVLLGVYWLVSRPGAVAADGRVQVYVVEGVINPVIVEYMTSGPGTG